MGRRVVGLIVLLALVAGLVGCRAGGSAGGDETVLTLVHGDTTLELTLNEVRAMPAVEGEAGIMTSTGRMVGPYPVKGVLLTTLLDELGGLTEDNGVEIAASDGYAMTFSANQILNGEFITYDPATGDEIAHLAPLQVMIAYEQEGKPLDAVQDGALRLVVVSDSNLQVVDGHWSVKWVERITLKEASAEWTVEFEGAISEPMDRGTFESGAAENCHQRTWTDEEGRVWTGIPLFYLLGRVDDEVKHGDDAYRDDLARKGYTIDVISGDGYTVTLDSALVTRNDDIIAAYLVDGQPLEEGDFPLRLVGSELARNQMVGGIARVVMHLPGADAAAPAEASEATEDDGEAPVGEAPAVEPPADAALVVTGCDDTEVTLNAEDLLGMAVVNATVEHPKKGPIDVTGVPLTDVLALVTIHDAAESITFVANDGYKVTLPIADVRACDDCLIAWDADGLSTAMPGFEGANWAKDLAQIVCD